LQEAIEEKILGHLGMTFDDEQLESSSADARRLIDRR